MAECPKCGEDLDKIKWEGKPRYDGDGGTSEKGKCPKCSKVFEWVCSPNGIWDPESEEYLTKA